MSYVMKSNSVQNCLYAQDSKLIHFSLILMDVTDSDVLSVI